MIKHGDIAAIALARPTHAALVSPERTVTWQQYAEEVAALAASLQKQFDLTKVAQVAFVSENRISLILLLSAFSTLGITTTGIDYLLTPEQAKWAIGNIGADLLVISGQQVGQAWAEAVFADWHKPAIDLDAGSSGALPWQTLIDASPIGATFAPPPARPFRALAYTSGTSGTAKATLRTRSADARRFHYFTTRYALHANDRYLLTIPVYHVAGNGWARHFLSIGASLHLVDVSHPTEIAQAVRADAPTAMVTTPIVLTRILDALEADPGAAGHALRFVVVGGKNFSPSQKRRALRVLGPVIYEYYGSTETGVNAIAEPADLLSHPESVGFPYAGQRIAALDADGTPLAIGQTGRLAVSSFLLMDGYIGTESNDVLIDGERFLVTPDHGYVGVDGRIYVLNRSAGKVEDFDVYAVEEAVRTLPGVRDVAIVIEPESGRQPDKADGVIVLKDPYSIDVEALFDKVGEALRAHGLERRHVRFVDSIPYSLSGKIRWTDVAALLAQPASASRDTFAFVK